MESRKRGRPRSVEADRAILEATRDLLLANGYEQLTIQAIAERAGVAKQTVYRRWPSKARIVADAVLSGALTNGADWRTDAADAPADLRGWLHAAAAGLARPSSIMVVRALAAAAAESDEDATRLYAALNEPSRRSLLERLRAGVARGDIRADADLEAAADALLGAMLYRVLARREVPLDEVDGLAEVVLRGLQAG